MVSFLFRSSLPIGCEKVIICDIMPLEAGWHALVFFWPSSNRFPCVNLHIPGVAAPGITCCPDLDPILAWFAWDVLYEWTATSEGDQALVHCHLRAWIVHQW